MRVTSSNGRKRIYSAQAVPLQLKCNVLFSELVYEEKISVHLLATANWQTCTRALQVLWNTPGCWGGGGATDIPEGEMGNVGVGNVGTMQCSSTCQFELPQNRHNEAGYITFLKLFFIFLFSASLLALPVFPPSVEWSAASLSLMSLPVFSTVRRVPRWIPHTNAPFGDLSIWHGMTFMFKLQSKHPLPSYITRSKRMVQRSALSWLWKTQEGNIYFQHYHHICWVLILIVH